MAKRTASVVIGSAFGDEGKGLMTDFLAFNAGARATVVRFNGGAQAGHTVQTPEGRRHVFHQFGSGALAGASTHLSKFFVANPILFLREREDLLSLKANTEVSVSGEALISTPWDMFANTEIETFRGAQRHGSCGMGIGETVGRHEETPFKLQMKDLCAPDLVRRLTAIRDEWLPRRLAGLGITPGDDTYSAIRSDELFERFQVDLANFCDQVNVMDVAQALEGREAIFEGAQGLLLDQNAGAPWFPYVTRSNTGLRNAVELAIEAGIQILDAHYMTRTYLTRHGAGPLPFECREKPFANIFDATNIPNPWQGTLRFAPLNLDLLVSAVSQDLSACASNLGVDVRRHLGVTCMDQTPADFQVVRSGELQLVTSKQALEIARQLISADDIWTSGGPTRKTLSKLL